MLVKVLDTPMYFPKSRTLGIISLVLLFAAALLIFVYFQGGVERAIYLHG